MNLRKDHYWLYTLCMLEMRARTRTVKRGSSCAALARSLALCATRWWQAGTHARVSWSSCRRRCRLCAAAAAAQRRGKLSRLPVGVCFSVVFISAIAASWSSRVWRVVHTHTNPPWIPWLADSAQGRTNRGVFCAIVDIVRIQTLGRGSLGSWIDEDRS